MSRKDRLGLARAAAYAFAALFVHGCVMIGYDPLLPQGEPAPRPVEAAQLAPVGGSDSPLGPLYVIPSGMPDASLPPLAIDSGSPPPVAQDAADEPPPPSTSDAGSDAGCAVPNGCGGCSELPATVGESCGVCGLGVYACSGTDDVVCEGEQTRPIADGSDSLIDDFEDGDAFVRASEARSGGWYTTSDRTGFMWPPVGSEFSPVSGGPPGNRAAGYVFGNGFMTWGATLAVSLSAEQCSYDASAYNGLRLLARGSGEVTVAIATASTVPVSEGGRCFTGCYDNFRAPLALTAEWQGFAGPWSAFRQDGWGTPAFFNPREVMYIEFAFPPETTFDLFIDNVGFF